MKVMADWTRFLQVAISEALTSWASAPGGLRLPPQTLRLTIGTLAYPDHLVEHFDAVNAPIAIWQIPIDPVGAVS
jgi:hypothetical protein